MKWRLLIVCIEFSFLLVGKWPGIPLSADGAGEVQGQTSWGTRFVFDRLLCFAFLGAVPGAGWASSSLGAPVPQNDSSRARGGPWAPPPRSVIFPRHAYVAYCLDRFFFAPKSGDFLLVFMCQALGKDMLLL